MLKKQQQSGKRDTKIILSDLLEWRWKQKQRVHIYMAYAIWHVAERCRTMYDSET